MSPIQNKLQQTPRKGGNPAWKKGVSGNPGGRPRAAEGLRQLLVTEFGGNAEKLVARLKQLSKSKNDRVALSAVELLLAYHAGRPTTVVDADMKQLTMILMPEDCWPDVGQPIAPVEETP
jgi:hypothetical protein